MKKIEIIKYFIFVNDNEAGFGEYNNKGYGSTFTPGKGYNMIVSKDQAVQAKLKSIMKKYQ